MNTKRQRTKPTLLLAAMLVLGCLTGCASQHIPPSADRNHLKNLDHHQLKGHQLSGIRYAALRDTALSVGARGGLSRRTTLLNKELNQQARTLDRIFDFQRLMLPQHVLPPVLVEGQSLAEASDEQTLRLADRTYRVITQARFVTTAPRWSDYLLMDFAPPEEPDPSLLPRNKAEKTIWKRYVDEGWEAGWQQADVIYAENLQRLRRDMEGMVRYRTLLAQGMVSAPYVASMSLGVTGDHEDMTINDQILRITDLPSLNPDSQRWITHLHEERPEAP